MCMCVCVRGEAEGGGGDTDFQIIQDAMQGIHPPTKSSSDRAVKWRSLASVTSAQNEKAT